ncbi:MAG: BatA domain-containing protein [Phycisphaerae bacterium]
MLALGFAAAGILLAAGAVAAPVAIHLIMRSKPRRILFPALQFVQKTHKATLSKLKLKHFVLLAMRILAILLIALLIAQPFYEQSQTGGVAAGPVAAVVVVDDSLSMEYRYQEQSVLARGRELAVEAVESLPDGSQVAVVRTSESGGPAEFSDDLGYVVRQIEQIAPTRSDRGLSVAVGRALNLLGRSNLPRRVVYILTDRTEHSWKDVQAAAWDQDTTGVILDAAAGAGANLWLGRVELSAQNVPVGSKVRVSSLLQSMGSGGRFSVQAELDGREILRKVSQIPSGSHATLLSGEAPLERPGVHQGRIWLTPDDALPADNERYFTIQAAPRPQALLVRDPATLGKGDELTDILTGSIAATGTASVRLSTPEQLTAQALEDSQIVLLAGVSGLTDAQWTSLARFVRAGGGLWVVPGPLVAARGYQTQEAVEILPARIEGLEAVDQGVRLTAGRFDHPLISAFADGRNGGFDPLRFYRRLELSVPAEQVDVPVRYSDGPPALLAQRVGSGAVVLWNFSPAGSFSNLTGFGQQLILTDRTLAWLAAPDRWPTQVQLGQELILRVPEQLGGATATVRRPGRSGRDPLAIDPATRQVTLRPDVVGHWVVEFVTAGQTIERGFSVNLDPAESDLQRLEAARIVDLFPPGLVRFGADATLAAAEGGRYRRDLTVWVLLVLLVLLVGEPFFANRFYRQQVEQTDAEGNVVDPGRRQ